jgi:uncharacterized protein
MKFLYETAILIIFGATALFLYVTYWDDVRYAIFGDEPSHTIYISSAAIDVTVADEPEERIQGLSGVKKLKDFEGKLFIFDTDGKHGIWMKDMLFPIDIIWIDKNLKVVHIEENALPSSYPNTVFAPPVDARFVLEMNAYFAASIKIAVGDRLTLAPSLLPADIKRDLQQ